MHVPNLRCDATHNGQRCQKSSPHQGWHEAGLVSWYDPAQARTLPKCASAIHLEGADFTCDEPAGHKSAHRSGGLIWTDPTPTPEDLL